STGDVILEAVHGTNDPDVIRYALGDIDRVLAFSTDPLLRFQNITLTPTDGFILSRVDGTLSAREIIQLAGLSPEETRKSLFGLLCTGVVAWTGGVRKPKAPPRPAAPSPSAVVPSLAVAPAHVVAPPPPKRPDAAPPSDPVTPATPIADAMAQRRKEILDAHEGLKRRNHFEVLGLARSATEVQVKEAYFRLARSFHPDVHHGASLGDLRDKLEAVFIRLGEAYEVLRSATSRASYEARLGLAEPAGSTIRKAPEPPPPPPDPAEEARKAEQAIRVAEKLYEKEKYWDAIQQLEPAVPIVQGKMKQRGHVVLARCYLKNPMWAKRAEEELLAAAREDPKSIDAHFILGSIYKERGLNSRALSMFRKVLELKPDHEEALVLVASAAPPTPPPEEGGGLIKRLFNKRS
ncbi:MAG: hypothetical protein DMF79_13700, partial [Acidobacteria bacterium]